MPCFKHVGVLVTPEIAHLLEGLAERFDVSHGLHIIVLPHLLTVGTVISCNVGVAQIEIKRLVGR